MVVVALLICACNPPAVTNLIAPVLTAFNVKSVVGAVTDGLFTAVVVSVVPSKVKLAESTKFPPVLA